jgi:plastocyanin
MGSTHPRAGVASLLLAAFAILMVGCGSGGGTGSSSSATTSASGSGSGGASGGTAVTIKDYTYTPETLTVPVGTTVKFTNEDTTAHTATSKEAGVFESKPIQPGKTGSIKLEKAGTFTYYCVFHPFMKGTIVVE